MEPLDDFTIGQPQKSEASSLKEFEVVEKTPIFNPKSGTNLLTKLGLLEGFGKPNVPLMMEELDNPDNMAHTAQLMEAARQEAQINSKDFVEKYAMEFAEVDLSNTKPVVNQWLEEMRQRMTVDQLLYKKALKEKLDSSEGRPEDYQDVFDYNQGYREAMQLWAAENQAISAIATKTDGITARKVGEFFEMWLPLADYQKVSSIREGMVGAVQGLKSGSPLNELQGAAFTGSMKKELVQAWQGLSPAAKAKALPALLDAVKGADSVILSENDMVTISMLKDILRKGEYGTLDVMTDNIFSLLDSTIILGSLARAVGRTGLKTGILQKGSGVTRAIEAENRARESIALTKALDEVKRKEVLDSQKQLDDVKQGATKKGKDAPRVVDVVSPPQKRALNDQVTGAPKPGTAGDIVKDVHPEAVEDAIKQLGQMTDTRAANDLSKSLFGRTVDDMKAWLFGPKVGGADGLVPNVPHVTNDDLMDAIRDMSRNPHSGMDGGNTADAFGAQAKSGRTDMAASEKSQDHSKQWGLLNQQQVAGTSSNAAYVRGDSNRKWKPHVLEPRPNMSTQTVTDDGGFISMVYAPGNKKNAHYSTARDANKAAESALREAGVHADEIKILRLNPGGRTWSEVLDKNNTTRGKHLIQVNRRYYHNPDNVDEWEDTFTKNKAARALASWVKSGSTGFLSGSLTSHIFDVASMLNPRIFLSSSVSADRATAILGEFARATKRMSKNYKALKKVDRDRLNSIWERANREKLDINRDNFSQYMSQDMFKVHKDFRAVQDALYSMENGLYVKTLRQQGFQLFKTKTDSDLFFAKPMGKPKGKTLNKVYDLDTGQVRKVHVEEQERLYEVGGVIGKLPEGHSLHTGQKIKHVMTQNNESSFARVISDNDRPLRYNHGYYKTYYTDPYFVQAREIGKDGNKGKWYVKGTARNSKQAGEIVENLRKHSLENPKDDVTMEYNFRYDKKNDLSVDEALWSSQIQRGATATRARGKQLESADNGFFDTPHIMSPAEATQRAIVDVSHRVAYRDWLDSTKARFMARFGDTPVLQNAKQYPKSMDEIVGETGEAGEARMIWEYIARMESGWTNEIDNFVKAQLTKAAGLFGNKGFIASDFLEEFFLNRARGMGPSTWTKKKVFQFYLAANPFRQILVQGHQHVQILALDPKYLLSGQLYKDAYILKMSDFLNNKIILSNRQQRNAMRKVGLDPSEAKTIARQWRETGFEQGISHSNLVRTDYSKGDVKMGRGGNKIAAAGDFTDRWFFDPLQKAGFNAGERFNLQTAWLLFRKRAIEAGKDMNSKTVQDQVIAEARNFTFNMNRAGDMPYNQNSLAAMLQFIQVPHKFATQLLPVFGNQVLTNREKMQLIGTTIGLYGLPLYQAVDAVGLLPEDPGIRQVIRRGLEATFLNWVIGNIQGQEAGLDFGSLSPWDSQPMLDLAAIIGTGNFGGLATEAPFMNLAANRVPKALQALARYTGLKEDFNTPTDFYEVAHSFAEITSGWSNYRKAMYVTKVGHKLSADGSKHYTAGWLERIAQVAGFRTYAEAEAYEMQMRLKGYAEDDVDMVRDYFKLRRHHLLAAKEATADNWTSTVEVLNEFQRITQDLELSEAAVNEIEYQLRLEMNNPEFNLKEKIFEAYGNGEITGEKLKSMIADLPGYTLEERRKLLKNIEDAYYSTRN